MSCSPLDIVRPFFFFFPSTEACSIHSEYDVLIYNRWIVLCVLLLLWVYHFLQHPKIRTLCVLYAKVIDVFFDMLTQVNEWTKWTECCFLGIAFFLSFISIRIEYLIIWYGCVYNVYIVLNPRHHFSLYFFLFLFLSIYHKFIGNFEYKIKHRHKYVVQMPIAGIGPSQPKI